MQSVLNSARWSRCRRRQVLPLVCKALRSKLQEPGVGVWGDVTICLDRSDDGTGALPATETLVNWLRTRKRGDQDRLHSGYMLPS